MMHYTHLTKIKAHHIHPQSYMQTLNLRGKKKKDDQEENKGKYFMKIPHTHTHTHTHTNLKLYNSKEGKTITTFYTFRVKLSDAREEEEEKKKKKKKKKKRRRRNKTNIQGGLASA